jgi:hypothetical protein
MFSARRFPKSSFLCLTKARQILILSMKPAINCNKTDVQSYSVFFSVIAQTQRTSDPATARTCAWASCGVAVTGIIATGIIIGVTAGVLLSNQCQYYYVNGVCYRYRTAAINIGTTCASTVGSCCPSGNGDTLFTYDGTNGYCYKP